MGWWGSHPLEGDDGLDVTGSLEYCMIENLIERVKNPIVKLFVNKELVDLVVRNYFDREGIWEECLCKFELRHKLYDYYKYKILREEFDLDVRYEYLYEQYVRWSVLIPFIFINENIRVKHKYVEQITSHVRNFIEDYEDAAMITFTNPEGYKTDKECLEYYLYIADKYKYQLFDEDNKELTKEFVKQHPEIVDVHGQGLFEKHLDKVENCIVTVD